MDTRVGRHRSRARSVATDLPDPEWLPPLTDLALALPLRLARAIAVVLQPGSTQPGRDGIDVPPMSSEWLQQTAVESEKRGSLP